MTICVADLNRFLGGWSGYLRYGNSARFFDKICSTHWNAWAKFVARRHQRQTRYGWWGVARRSPNRLGLIDCQGCFYEVKGTSASRL